MKDIGGSGGRDGIDLRGQHEHRDIDIGGSEWKWVW